MNEKCSSGCTYSNIEKCIHDSEMNCLPKLFYGIIPDYRPQPHTGYEFGDVSQNGIEHSRQPVGMDIRMENPLEKRGRM